MNSPQEQSGRAGLGFWALIAGVVAIGAVAFVFTAGWLSPHRLTPEKLVASLAPPGGPALGRRRNHVKGVCFTGVFEANGAGMPLSTAPMFVRGQYPVVGRFNVATPDPNAPDGTARVRGMGLQITAPGEEVWRSAMITAPFFPVSTPQAFYELQLASHSKDPGAMQTFAAAHPEFAAFGAWAKSAPWTGSFAEERYNSLNSFVFTHGTGQRSVVRWSLLPTASPVAVVPDDLAKRAPDFLEEEIAQRIQSGPLRWTMVVTVAGPGDATADPSKAWPSVRRAVDVGTLVVQQVQPDRDGPCRDINYDPTVLPAGVTTSDDPFPAARSAAYRVSFDRRTAEEKDWPRTAPEAK
ncbi:MAG TPA: catalase family peroxidase [Caulobacteraceae bacterium]|jgi:catalase